MREESDNCDEKNKHPNKLSVLVIEPNKEMQRILRSMLASCKIRNVCTHANSERAANSILSEPPDLILLDWEVKPFDGSAFLKMIRNKNMHPVCLVPIIVMFSEARKSWVEKAMKLGAHAVIAKPMSSTDLLSRITWILAGNRKLRLNGAQYVIEGANSRLVVEEERQKQMESAREYQASQFAEMLAIQSDIDKLMSG